MKCKYSNKRSEKEKFKHISDNDKNALELLHLQLIFIYIYMMSDVFLFIGTTESINICYGKKEDNNPVLLLEQGQILALIANIINNYITSTRYSQLTERYNEEEISLEPEFLVKQASILSIILYSLNVIAVSKQYKASLVINIFKCDKNSINLLFLQAVCFLMRFYGDYFLLRSTLKSIDLIRSKYDKSIKNIYNPDIDAVIAAEFYVLQRGVLYDIGCTALVTLINNGTELEKELLLPAQQTLVIANIIGVIANITVLIAFIKIYNRNENQPIFGR
jgi:hypothetical protein